MAAVSHLKNKREAKSRETLEKLLTKCSASVGGPVCVKQFLDTISSQGVQLDSKELAKLDRITDGEGQIDRQEFLEFARKSPAIKDLVEGEREKPKTSHLDKAELAFKAIDKDGSGYIDAGELGKLGGKMSSEQTKALLTKLDKDGDGKINLQEFRTLFK